MKDSTSTGTILSETKNGIISITMSNPDKKNAINKAMYFEMARLLNESADEKKVRVVLIRGDGGIFTSGNDVSDFSRDSNEEPAALHFLRAIMGYPKPVVAQVEGLAIGIGTTMLLHSDLVYAADDAQFRLPFVSLGVVPEAASSYILPRLVGQSKAAELLLLGEMFDAKSACDMGIVNALHPAKKVAKAAEEAALKLTKQPPQALIKTKALLRDCSYDGTVERMMAEGKIFGDCINGEEFAEAATAFLQKREPDFSKF
jgi:enoyl-CoA hydratase/carnithine racemase